MDEARRSSLSIIIYELINHLCIHTGPIREQYPIPHKILVISIIYIASVFSMKLSGLLDLQCTSQYIL